jgi:hypothetical protein
MRCASVSIGIVDYFAAEYRESNLRLRYSVSDAEAFHRYMSLGYPSRNAQHVLLIDGAAVDEKVQEAIQDASSHGPLDLFVLYLSGHGEIGRAESGWFCLADAKPRQPSLDSAALDRYLGAIDADSILVFIDCCHAESVIAGSHSFAVSVGRRVRLAAVSCRANQRSWEDDTLKRSIFSDVLLRALSTDSPIADPRGQVDIQARLLPYLRDQVPIAASAAKRGQTQEPLSAGFLGGLLALSVVSTESLGRPLSIGQAIRASVRRFLIASAFALVIGLAIIDLLIFHIAVDGSGKVLVRPGFAATFALIPVHLTPVLDTGLSIRDMNLINDRLMAALAKGSLWGVSTHRDAHGLKTWIAVLQPGMKATSINPIQALAFGELHKLDPGTDAAPVTEVRFLAKLMHKTSAELSAEYYPYDSKFPWACTDDVSNKLDFTMLEPETSVFRLDSEWVAATASSEAHERAQELGALVKLAAYRALKEENGDHRVAEFEVFATALERIAGSTPDNAFQAAAAPFLQSTRGNWCSIHGALAEAIIGGSQDSLSAESELLKVFESYDRSQQGDLASPNQSMAVIGLSYVARRRPLDSSTLGAIYQMIKRDGADLTAVTPATDLLKEVAVTQELTPELRTLILSDLRTETSDADFVPMAAASLLARNFRFLNVDERTKLRLWIREEARPNALVSEFHEILGFVSLSEPLRADQLELLRARLSSLSHFPPQSTDYRGEMVIDASGDNAAVALGRAAQSQPLTNEVAERLANFAASRTDVVGRDQIIRGLARQWYGGTPNPAKQTADRLAHWGRDATRRALEVEVASAAISSSTASNRKDILNQLIAAWSTEIEPSQRIALGKVIGSIGQAGTIPIQNTISRTEPK